MKADLTHLDAYRSRADGFTSPSGARYGAFCIPRKRSREQFVVICDDGANPEHPTGWEHVSVRIVVDEEMGVSRVASYYELAEIKRMFWDNHETVVHFFVDDSSKINIHPAVLHLWRPVDGQFPLPDPKMV
jgi:hypothetical protein